jgi:hypothetical protein
MPQLLLLKILRFADSRKKYIKCCKNESFKFLVIFIEDFRRKCIGISRQILGFPTSEDGEPTSRQVPLTNVWVSIQPFT